MHAVGIRRVFWTTASATGDRQGRKAKVLVAGMDSVGNESARRGDPVGNGVFVTKHEVLMMRRIIGARSAASPGEPK